MNSVLIDNWSIQDSIKCIYSLDDYISESYQNLLTGIVLWDNLYFIKNRYSEFYSYYENIDVLKEILIPLEIRNKENDFEEDNNIVANGALRYLKIANEFELDYLTFGKRKEFLINSINNIKDKFIRSDSLEPLNFQTKEYYKNQNVCFEKELFTIERPVLIDYILQKTPPNMSHIQYALELRERKEVINYKKFLNKVERRISLGNKADLIEINKISKELSDEIVGKTSNKVGTVGINVFPIPPFLQLSGNYSNEININRHSKQFCFLQTLCKFSLKERNNTKNLITKETNND